jgi:hypothetical protein
MAALNRSRAFQAGTVGWIDDGPVVKTTADDTLHVTAAACDRTLENWQQQVSRLNRILEPEIVPGRP